jgi:hypothetical protein
MRIAHIAPLTESVPPKGYGGIERVVYYLVEEQMRLGHQVTLFASGDSQTSAAMVPGCSRALGYSPEIRNPFPHYRAMLDGVLRRAGDFDPPLSDASELSDSYGYNAAWLAISSGPAPILFLLF